MNFLAIFGHVFFQNYDLAIKLNPLDLVFNSYILLFASRWKVYHIFTNKLSTAISKWKVLECWELSPSTDLAAGNIFFMYVLRIQFLSDCHQIMYTSRFRKYTGWVWKWAMWFSYEPLGGNTKKQNLNNFSTTSPISDFKMSLDMAHQDLKLYFWG